VQRAALRSILGADSGLSPAHRTTGIATGYTVGYEATTKSANTLCVYAFALLAVSNIAVAETVTLQDAHGLAFNADSKQFYVPSHPLGVGGPQQQRVAARGTI
jgi:hypothetical protein